VVLVVAVAVVEAVDLLALCVFVHPMHYCINLLYYTSWFDYF